MAAFQALIELNLCCPERLRSAELSDKIIILESFWDSGVQRFGEEGAKGWSFWMDNKESLHAESESSGKGILQSYFYHAHFKEWEMVCTEVDFIVF